MRGRWLKKNHECKYPVAGNRGIGSVWQCRCGIRWQIKDKRVVGVYEHVKWGRE